MGRHLSGGEEEKKPEPKGKKEHGGHDRPQIHIHSHAKGHTVHILHQDGRHEKHEHGHGDSEGIAQHIHEQLGGSEGQDHGYSAGDEMENESGFGPGV